MQSPYFGLLVDYWPRNDLEKLETGFQKCKKNVTSKMPVTFPEALFLLGWANFLGFRFGLLIPMLFEAMRHHPHPRRLIELSVRIEDN
jgi:hypothetical protein